MLWAYVLEVGGTEDNKCNQAIFQLIKELEIEDDYCFFDMDGTGDRSELKKLLDKIQSGDRLIIRSVLDMADTTEDLFTILSVLSNKKITLCSYDEPYLCGDNYLKQIKGVFSIYLEFIRRKQEQAYKKAVSEGKVGRPSKAKEIEKALELYNSKKVTMEQLQALTGVSKSTLYRYIKNK